MNDTQIATPEVSTSVDATAPWWKRTGLITLLAACVSAVPPLTVGVGKWIDGWHAREAAKEKHLHELRQVYLDKALDPALSNHKQLILFEFLVSVFSDDPISPWAEKNLADINKKLASKRAQEGATSYIEQMSNLADGLVIGVSR